jgi:hypothetical protein
MPTAEWEFMFYNGNKFLKNAFFSDVTRLVKYSSFIQVHKVPRQIPVACTLV